MRGELRMFEREHGGSWTVRIAYPPEVARYLVFKGSVAVEGISLTVAGLGEDYFEVAIIPKTWAVTNLSHLRAGDPVNIEADIIAKYVERILAVGNRETGGQSDAGPGGVEGVSLAGAERTVDRVRVLALRVVAVGAVDAARADRRDPIEGRADQER